MVFACNIFVYTIDGLESFTIHKASYVGSSAYTRAMDGGASWVIMRYVRRTPADLILHYILYTNPIIYNEVPTTVGYNTAGVLTMAVDTT